MNKLAVNQQLKTLLAAMEKNSFEKKKEAKQKK